MNLIYKYAKYEYYVYIYIYIYVYIYRKYHAEPVTYFSSAHRACIFVISI